MRWGSLGRLVAEAYRVHSAPRKICPGQAQDVDESLLRTTLLFAVSARRCRLQKGRRELVQQGGLEVPGQDHAAGLRRREADCDAVPGPGGCLQSELGVSCDIKGNAPGTRCGRDDEGAAACVEEHKMIACRGGQYRSVPCRGPKGCETEGDHAMCDTAIGE